MRRPIKFRAWDKEARKFFKPEPRLNAMTISITLNGEIIGHPDIGEMTSLYELSQFTGLTDKNDKEIYEGDILSVKRHKDKNNWASELVHLTEFAEVVSFEKGCFVMEGTRTPVSQFIWDIVHHNIKAEIIGNIYQHPELLKGGNPA